MSERKNSAVAKDLETRVAIDPGFWLRPGLISSLALLGCLMVSFHLSRHSCSVWAIGLIPLSFHHYTFPDIPMFGEA